MESSPPAAHDSAPDDLDRRRDRVLGLVIVAVAFAICLLISLWSKEQSRPETSEPPGPPTLKGIVGWPNTVDTVDTLPAARALTRRPLLRGMVITGVKSDGSLDFSAPGTRVRYAFQSPPGHGPQPEREPGTLPKRASCGKQNVIIDSRGMVAEKDQADYPCARPEAEGLPTPRCSLREIWRIARKRNIPTAAPAQISYFRAKAGPAWRFEIPGGAQRFTIYGDCKRELQGSEAQGSVP
jgi:hypothetical protein